MKRRPTPAAKQPSPDQLDAEEIVWRIDNRARPDGHPNPNELLEMPDSDYIRLLAELFASSDVMPKMERRFGKHPGKQSKLPLLALLIGMFYTGGAGNRYWRTDLANFLATLDPRVAVYLGIQSVHNLLKPITYTVVCKQATRVESGLREGWTDDDGTRCDLTWFTEALLPASNPKDLAWRVTAVAVDSTDAPTWAKRRLWKDDDEPLTEDEIAELNKPVRPRKGAKRRKFTRTTNLIGHTRTNGKRILGKDIDAGSGHRNKAGDHDEGMFHGSHLTLAVAVKPRRVTRSHRKAKFGPAIAAHIVGMDFCPAGTAANETGIATVESAVRLCPGINDVTADIGFTQTRQTFNRKMHEMRIHLTKDHRKDTLAVAKPVKLGPSGYPAFVHAGTFLHACTPKKHRVPPKGLNKKQLREFYAERQKFALTLNQRLPKGAMQFESPIHKGRFTINPAQTTGAAGKTLYPKPRDFSTLFPGIPDKVLYKQFITVTADELLDYQQPQFGTKAQRQTYGRRQQSENAIAQVKQATGLNNKLCRVVSGGARHIAVLARVVWYNLNLTRDNDKQAQEEKQTRRAANKTRPKTYIPQRFVVPEPAAPSHTVTDDPDPATPRAPP